MMSSKALFHAFMYGAAWYSYITRGPQENRHGLQEMELTYAGAIHELNEEMKCPVKACSDENIMAVLIMGHKNPGPAPSRTGKLPAQAPLKGLQSLDIYGKSDLVPMHVLGLKKLVELRGGVENIELDGLATIVSL
jgi:hypothetical protein